MEFCERLRTPTYVGSAIRASGRSRDRAVDRRGTDRDQLLTDLKEVNRKLVVPLCDLCYDKSMFLV